MKKILLLSIIVAFTVSVKAQSQWNIGVQFSALANPSKFYGGMTDANALFTNNPYGSAQIGVSFRRAINNHFSVQSGFDFSEFGFTYTLARDYSLTKAENHYAELRTGTCISRIPVIGIYNSKLNCRNVRFIAGLGFSIEAIDNDWQSENSKTVEGDVLGNSSSSVMKEVTHSTTCMSGSFITLIGLEKVFSRGNMFSLTMQGNWGFAPIAQSTVTYMVNNKNYNHTFSNSGSYCAMTLSYYFLPIGTRKMNNSGTPPVMQK